MSHLRAARLCRALRTTPSLRIDVRATHLAVSGKTFATSPRPQQASGKDIGPGKEHTLDKGPKGDPNVQSHESDKGRKNRASGTGGTATEQRDTTGSTDKAKKDFPEAPDTVIGMQDERGGKGH